MNNMILFFVALYFIQSFSAKYLINLTNKSAKNINVNYYKEIKNIVFCNSGFMYNKKPIDEPSFINKNTGNIYSIGNYLNRVLNDKYQCVRTGQNLKTGNIIVTHIANVEHSELNSKTGSIIVGLYRYENDQPSIEKVFVFNRYDIKTVTHSYDKKIIKNEFNNGENTADGENVNNCNFIGINWDTIDLTELLLSPIDKNKK